MKCLGTELLDTFLLSERMVKMENLNKRTKVKMDAVGLRGIFFRCGLKQVDVAREADLCTVIVNRACTNRIISLKSARSILKVIGYGWDEAIKDQVVTVL